MLSAWLFWSLRAREPDLRLYGLDGLLDPFPFVRRVEGTDPPSCIPDVRIHQGGAYIGDAFRVSIGES